ncbi:MAG: sigma-54-dependent Fis family transcriptional regulator [Bacillota bacterium]
MQNVTNDRQQLLHAWHCFIEQRKITSAHVRPVILASWERCAMLKVNPYQPQLKKLPPAVLAATIVRHQNLILTAKPFMESLFRLVAGSGFVVTLCDAQGNLLELLGDAEVLNEADNINLVPGVNWAEAYMGTTAIGVALETGQPVQVCSVEHYCKPCHDWTCSAAPIRAPQGDQIAILNMSGHFLKVHPHTLGMVVAAAQAIEHQLKNQQISASLALSNKYLRAVLESMSDGVITVNQQGQVVEINSVAARLFSLPPEQVLTRPLPASLAEQLKIKEVLQKGREYIDKEVSIEEAGKRVHCTVAVKPISKEGSSIAGAVATIQEIKTVRRLVQRMIGARALFTFDDILAQSKTMRQTMALAKLAAENSLNILILGESGTGKELLAQAIHNASSRTEGPFVAINCGAIPKDLIGSEMFGYTEGAFTGAKHQGSPGKFELADGGTIFLDEIGDMPLDLQAALLRFIQDRQLIRIGGSQVIPVDVRIITATNKNLSQEVSRGNFRQDLYYRLNVFPIHVPPLRERAGDITLLARHFLEKMSHRLGKRLYFSTTSLACLESYSWPGNVRELENAVQRLAYLVPDGPIQRETVMTILGERHSPSPPKSMGLSLSDLEKDSIREAIRVNSGNLSQAAKVLGIGRTTLYRKIKKYGLEAFLAQLLRQPYQSGT